MSSKSRTRNDTRTAISPLLRALTFSRVAHEPVTQTMLLQCYTGLDAFRRGHGSRALFTTLGRRLLVAEELGRLGYHRDEIEYIQWAHAAMLHIDATEKEGGVWLMSDVDYARLCRAFETFGRQLSVASLGGIAKAEARMVGGLLKAERTLALAEAPA
ncbi:hypothetical protein [Paraburkholderia kirstenboschensis]|uniref:Fis family transcriptional regulator n=1 Tax=Paraburkholderia kirstenboschensis TaxID=1245436 RepID=A0ABZ0EKY2_9BURK|nr:hypothetical protein [Paraburkholderia kirstenboschensis]WOD16982.1 hypothetical protein RW095_14090 [Paraburkholderia kirstenboschensis]